MIKTLAAAAVLSLGLAGYAVAQDTRRPLPLRWPSPCITTTITIIIITITTTTCTTTPPSRWLLPTAPKLNNRDSDALASLDV